MTEFTEKTLLNLVGSAYEAALKPELWPAHVELWRQILDSTQAKLLVYDLSQRQGTIEVSAGADPLFNRLYHERFARLCPWAEPGATAIEPEQVLRCEQLVPIEQLTRTEYYDDFLAPQDVMYEGGPVLFRDRGIIGALVLGRSETAGPFDDHELVLQQRMLPHLQRATELHRRLTAAGLARNGLLGAVETMPGAIMLVDERSRLIAFNLEASSLFALHDGLGLTGRGEVEPRCSDAAARLTELIGAALQTAAGAGLSPGGAVKIPRPTGKRPFVVTVAPLSSLSSGRQSEAARAVLYVDDPEARLSPALDGLKSAFGLTRAEAGLALRLAGGQSLAEAADELNVTLNTVRTHLKRIFSKTDTRRQGELVSLLLTNQPVGRRVLPRAQLPRARFH